MKMILPLLAAALVASPAAAQGPTDARIARILRATPLIDGHNDLPWALRQTRDGDVEGTELGSGTDRLPKPLMTDMARMRAGGVGAQFWSVYIPAAITGDAAVRTTIEQIDIARRIVASRPQELAMAATADDIVRIHRSGRIASLFGIEGGHQIGANLAALRQFHTLGARYMTLTHWATNEWADAATDAPKHGGLSPFGVAVVREMNRLGMLVDLSHVAPATMRDALDATRAPVIFSHSNAYGLTPHPRNVPDDVLARLKGNGGVVMITFVPAFTSKAMMDWNAARDGEQARLKALNPATPDAVPALLKTWESANPMPAVGIKDVADHIDHVARVAGHDHVGIGGDLDGIAQTIPGLDHVGTYPALFAELIARGWTDANLAKLAGGNALRAMRGAEGVAAAMRAERPGRAKL